MRCETDLMTPKAFDWRKCWSDRWLKVIVLTKRKKQKKKKVKLIWWRSGLSIGNEMLIWPLAQGYRICEKAEKEEKLNSWSIVRRTIRLKIHIRMLERIRLIVFIQYTKNLFMLFLVISLLGTSIEGQISKSISFYSWQRIITRMRMTRWSTDTSTEDQTSSSISINFEWLNNNQRWCSSKKKN